MTENLTDDGYEQLAIDLQERKIEALWTFDQLFTSRFYASALRNGLSITNAEIFAETCSNEIPIKVNGYFMLKQQLNPEGKFFEKWVWARAKKIRLRFHSLINRLEVTERNIGDKRSKEGEWLGVPAQQLSEFFTLPEGNNFEKEQFWKALQEAVQSLPDVQRDIFVLRYLNGRWSFTDIAGHLGIDESAARVYAYRARQTLKKHLSRDLRWQSWLENHHK